MLSVRIFCSCVVGHECFFKCWAIELVSGKCHNLQRQRRPYTVVICKKKSYITFVIDSPLMMAQSRAESTRDTYNYGQYLNQFPPNTIKVIREFEQFQKKICRHKMSIMFNEICIYIYIYIYIIKIYCDKAFQLYNFDKDV